jgi:hypothetical protein
MGHCVKAASNWDPKKSQSAAYPLRVRGCVHVCVCACVCVCLLASRALCSGLLPVHRGGHYLVASIQAARKEGGVHVVVSKQAGEKQRAVAW